LIASGAAISIDVQRCPAFHVILSALRFCTSSDQKPRQLRKVLPVKDFGDSFIMREVTSLYVD
jgi:hypothetical protein